MELYILVNSRAGDSRWREIIGENGKSLAWVIDRGNRKLSKRIIEFLYWN